MIRNPDSVRPWQFVLEPLSGYLQLAAKLYTHGKAYSGGWNFGPSSYENYKVADVIAEIKKIIPAIQFNIKVVAEKHHEAGLLKLDITKAVNQLEWKPRLNLSQNIEFAIAGYLQEIQNPKEVYQNRILQIEKYINS